jgi:glycine cleavage system H protein
MKELDELKLPDDVRYSDDHEWARQEGERIRIGISDFAQDRLGDITFVELPEVGDVLNQGDEFGTVESTKAASEMLLPVSGEVAAVNKALEEAPDLINKDPYGRGWIIELNPTHIAEFDELMSKDDYQKMLKGTE